MRSIEALLGSFFDLWSSLKETSASQPGGNALLYLLYASYVRPVIRRYIEAQPFRKREPFSQFESG